MKKGNALKKPMGPQTLRTFPTPFQVTGSITV